MIALDLNEGADARKGNQRVGSDIVLCAGIRDYRTAEEPAIRAKEHLAQSFPIVGRTSRFPFLNCGPATPLVKKRFLRCSLCALAFVLIGAASVFAANEQAATFKIPPVKIPLNVKDQKVMIAASGVITLIRKEGGLNILRLELSADLADLQANLTDILSAQLDKNDRCGDRIAIQHATLTPEDPASLAVVQLHYERWGCAKILGKQETKKLTGGNAVMQMKLTPAVEENNTELRLVPEVGPVEADGSLGELLRTGPLGEMLREKIRKAILNALQKGTDLSATLPPVVQGYATIRKAQFKDGGAERLLAVLGGEVRISDQQIEVLAKQVKERTAAR